MFEDFPREFFPVMHYELWRYRPDDALAHAYHWLNVCEAFAWFFIAALVARRLIRQHLAPCWESVYFFLFIAFGVSDLWESQAVPVWLIAAKGLIFTGIVLSRRVLIKHHYREAKF